MPRPEGISPRWPRYARARKGRCRELGRSKRYLGSRCRCLFPPTDFLDWDGKKAIRIEVLGPLLFVGGAEGHSDDEITEAARAISPLHRVAKPVIPFLLIHGDADPVVPLSQSKKLVEAITKAGGSAELIVKPGGGHPWLTIPQEVKVMADWFDKHLASEAGKLTPAKAASAALMACGWLPNSVPRSVCFNSLSSAAADGVGTRGAAGASNSAAWRALSMRDRADVAHDRGKGPSP